MEYPNASNTITALESAILQYRDGLITFEGLTTYIGGIYIQMCDLILDSAEHELNDVD